MARADRRRAARQARTARDVRTTGGARVAIEQEMFFPKLRRQAKWMFVFLALVFGLGFVLFGVGSGSSGLSDLLQGNWDLFGSTDPGEKEARNARERIEKNPDDAAAYRALATALQTQGETDEAIAALEQYRALRPRDTEALGELAALYLRRAGAARDRGNAIQARAGAANSASLFRLDPTTKLGQALSGSVDPSVGYDPVNTAVSTVVNEDARSAFQEMDAAYKNAVQVYEAIAKVTPKDPNAWSQLAQAAEAAGDVPRAIQAYEQFLKVAPDDPLAEGVRQRLEQLQRSQAQSSVNVGG